MKNYRKSMLVLTATIVMGSSSAYANYVVDGNFASPYAGADYIDYSAGSNIGPWHVDSGSVDLIGERWQHAPNNSYSVDLDGWVPGSMSQALATTAGTYRLTFSLAGNVGGPDPIKYLRVSAGDHTQDYSFAIAGHTLADMGWVNETFMFHTTGPTSLKFASLDPNPNSNGGPVVGNVSISAVPLPASLPLFLAGLLAMAGFYRFKKQRMVA